MDFFEREHAKEKELKILEERAKRLNFSIKELINDGNFKRFIKELSFLQSIEEARYFDNPLAMSFNNGRRSIMVEIKALFTPEQWSKIMEYKLDVRTNSDSN